MKPNDSIITDRLVLRHWNKQDDAAAFHRLNNDPKVMHFFPARKTPQESDALLDTIRMLIDQNGYSWSAITFRETGQVIGFGGISAVSADFPNGPSTEIGWRFLPEF